jgi:hypothetical protein
MPLPLPLPKVSMPLNASGRTMFSNFLVTVRSYFSFYDRYFSMQWAEMSPQKYGMLLVCVGLFGWLLMKAGNKRA